MDTVSRPFADTRSTTPTTVPLRNPTMLPHSRPRCADAGRPNAVIHSLGNQTAARIAPEVRPPGA
ncbi:MULTISPECIES: hypothetical protein [unclassified Pseudofrankia]|uniref:hypothetical protein n=1 Tax=unclassified Pseudofrankia TaxID=2994372 RepID=UPI0010426782|nr:MULTISPECIES: hypothetical protein [unclassified Pseudofrankia]MDT3440011.1 hypothetical protein [Pseudofrankia sp. BMG5.37]